MKQKLSISVDSETVESIRKCLQSGRFRNVSHLTEYAVTFFLREANDAKD